MKNKIKLFVMDVDGTLTDGKIYMSESGELFKTFDVRDGYAISTILKRQGIRTAIITGRYSEIVAQRSLELGIDYIYQGIKNKLECLNEITKEVGISLHEVAFIGDDMPDLECIKFCAHSGCPADAVDEIRANAKYTCVANGGCGAVREYVEYLFSDL